MKSLKNTILEKLRVDDININEEPLPIPKPGENEWNHVWPYDTDIIEDGLKKELPFAKSIEVQVWKGIQGSVSHYIKIYLQDKKDFPNGLTENAAVWVFEYLGNWKWDLVRSPHMYLSPFDKSGQNEYDSRLKYLAMRGAEDLRKECGMKIWRKCALKSEKDLIKKISEYMKTSFALVELYTGSYPYHDGILNQSIKIAAQTAGIK